jgi:hypothetical protein
MESIHGLRPNNINMEQDFKLSSSIVKYLHEEMLSVSTFKSVGAEIVSWKSAVFRDSSGTSSVLTSLVWRSKVMDSVVI